MRVDTGLAVRGASDAPLTLTIGSFDGVHRGHAALLDEVDRAAQRLGSETGVLTFEPHPRCVLDPGNCPPSLSTTAEKGSLLAARGVDRLVVLPFTREVSMWTADEFCDRLRAAFDVRALVLGHDFALGHRRQGDAAFLRAYGERWGIEVHQVRATLAAGEPVSSTRIRDLLGRGAVGAANTLLGHVYVAETHNEGRSAAGYQIRIQLDVPEEKCLPAPGVYAAWAGDGELWQMATAVVDRAAAHTVAIRAMEGREAELPRSVDRVAFVGGLGGGPAGEHHAAGDGDAERARSLLLATPPPA